MSEVTGGVSRLVSRPRKKRTKNFNCQQQCWSPSRCLKNSNGLATRFCPRDAAGDDNVGSLEPNRLLRLELNK